MMWIQLVRIRFAKGSNSDPAHHCPLVTNFASKNDKFCLEVSAANPSNRTNHQLI